MMPALPITVIPMRAAGPIFSCRILSFTTTRGEVIQSTGPTGTFIGVSDDNGDQGISLANTPPVAINPGQMVGVITDGVAKVLSGGTLTVGSLITSDAQGRAVNGTTAANSIGICMDPGAGIDSYCLVQLLNRKVT